MTAPSRKALAPGELGDAMCVVVGTRPSIVKQGPLIRALQRCDAPFIVIHTGQHYSPEMDRALFDDLELPQPTFRLDGIQNRPTHGGQTAAMLEGVETILLQERPRVVLVGGDANTNLAAALAARKLHIPVAHVEAGLRSYDWRMPEEHNRVMIDHISELLFAPSERARKTMEGERVRGRIHVVGTTVVDAVLEKQSVAERRSRILSHLGLENARFAVLTLHREENVDDVHALDSILRGVMAFADQCGLHVVFPAHPRTRDRLTRWGLTTALDRHIRLVEPLGHLDFTQLLAKSVLLVTDSGGAQQEACILGVPCVTARPTTEWVETVAIGANRVAGVESEAICRAAMSMVTRPPSWSQPFGDGHAAERIIAICQEPIPMPPLSSPDLEVSEEVKL